MCNFNLFFFVLVRRKRFSVSSWYIEIPEASVSLDLKKNQFVTNLTFKDRYWVCQYSFIAHQETMRSYLRCSSRAIAVSRRRPNAIKETMRRRNITMSIDIVHSCRFDVLFCPVFVSVSERATIRCEVAPIWCDNALIISNILIAHTDFLFSRLHVVSLRCRIVLSHFRPSLRNYGRRHNNARGRQSCFHIACIVRSHCVNALSNRNIVLSRTPVEHLRYSIKLCHSIFIWPRLFTIGDPRLNL